MWESETAIVGSLCTLLLVGACGNVNSPPQPSPHPSPAHPKLSRVFSVTGNLIVFHTYWASCCSTCPPFFWNRFYEHSNFSAIVGKNSFIAPRSYQPLSTCIHGRTCTPWTIKHQILKIQRSVCFFLYFHGLLTVPTNLPTIINISAIRNNTYVDWQNGHVPTR